MGSREQFPNRHQLAGRDDRSRTEDRAGLSYLSWCVGGRAGEVCLKPAPAHSLPFSFILDSEVRAALNRVSPPARVPHKHFSVLGLGPGSSSRQQGLGPVHLQAGLPCLPLCPSSTPAGIQSRREGCRSQRTGRRAERLPSLWR